MIFLAVPADDEDLLASSDLLVASLAGRRSRDPIRVEPFHYAWSTGLTHTVRQEVALACADQPATEQAVADHLAQFDLGAVADMPLPALSGGWSKYVLFSLLLARAPTDADLVLTCMGQYLDDAHIVGLIAQLRCRDADTYLLELDPLVMKPWYPELALLWVGGERDGTLRAAPDLNAGSFRSAARLSLP